MQLRSKTSAKRHGKKGSKRRSSPLNGRARGDRHHPPSPVATASEGRASAPNGRFCALAPLWLVGALIDSLRHASSWASWRVSGGVSKAESFPWRRLPLLPPTRPPNPSPSPTSKPPLLPATPSAKECCCCLGGVNESFGASVTSVAGPRSCTRFLHFGLGFCFTL